MARKKFSPIDVVLSVICVVFTIEAAAPASAMGNVQFFWRILLIVTFLVPYGLVVVELGTTYDSDGGLYDWVREGLGDAWAARCSWYYWVNFPMWMASLACLFPSIMNSLWGIELSMPVRILIELAFVWGVTALAFSPVSDAEWIMNGGAVIKVFITAVVAGAGIWFAATNGFANDLAFETFLPNLASADSLTYLSVILFNFMGFEVVATFTSSMENPQRDIPKAIVVGGIVIAAIYILCGIGIGAAVPVEELSLDSGIVDAVIAMLGASHPLTLAVGVVFLVTLFANMTSWSFGINSVASYAARHGNMLAPWGILSKKTGMPNGSAVMTAVVASVVLCLQLVLPAEVTENIFWVLFSTNVVFLLLSYLPMFPAFWQLRKHDDRPRVFRAPFEGGLLAVVLVIPAVELVLSIVATIVPLNGTADELAKLPMLFATIGLVALGEVVRVVSKRGRGEDYRGVRACGPSDGWAGDLSA
ncbi:APC family permease [Olsenella sp. YH-ols2217]|uniref:APC family permease n=1 Tax=Kribbibacterium absianum TaxID=3044210 RepID=A0ABT6ZKK3_9ACTN|nr:MULTISPECIES: APC family permease [unclassified Olsenella]MDJ1122407.1 APC family permease [Olsenella sp. YH-ols2216]MDJ1129339.1 APC family permease [Olsenella sp. YH-ols2217]